MLQIYTPPYSSPSVCYEASKKWAIRIPNLPFFLPPSSSSSRKSLMAAAVPVPLAASKVEDFHREEEGPTDLIGHCEYQGVCAICLDRILLQEIALVKGCEHAYCVNCILRWATYKEKHSCPQCNNPFNFLMLHKSLDGCINDFLLEESVCLLLRAAWFVSFVVKEEEDANVDRENDIHYDYDEYIDEYDFDESYLMSRVSNLRIGNRRWGGNGYVRNGRKEAKPISRQIIMDADVSSSRAPNNDVPTYLSGRQAKRALKREVADKVAAAKHEKHLQRLGRK